MVRLERFDIELNNPEEAYFAGQEISGKVIIETSEPKKVNEILLELKGRARTYWTKHSGKSRKHCSHSEPYFLEQFNTAYTHKFTVTNDKGKERVLPAGKHEVPFSYTLPKTLPSSFEGEFGHIRYTCKAICERPWDFDIVCRKPFTVVGIEDINEDPKSLEPATASESNYNIRFCCRKQGSITAELRLDRSGYTPGEEINVNATIKNESSRALKNSTLRIRQTVNYRAKTFAGHEQVKTAKKVVAKKERGEISPHSVYEWTNEKIALPSVPPRLSRCKIITVTYALELEVEQSMTVSLPLLVGSIPLLTDLILSAKGRNGRNGTTPKAQTTPPEKTIEESGVQVTITDESGQTVASSTDDDAMSNELDALLSARKRVRMPSSILSELYPTLPSPYYKESHFGKVDISDDKEKAQYGVDLFAPKYPFYTD